MHRYQVDKSRTVVALCYVKLAKLELEFSRIRFPVWVFISAEHKRNLYVIWNSAVEGAGHVATALQSALMVVGTHRGVKFLHLLFLCFLGQVHTGYHDNPDVGNKRGIQFLLMKPSCPIRLQHGLAPVRIQRPVHTIGEDAPRWLRLMQTPALHRCPRLHRANLYNKPLILHPSWWLCFSDGTPIYTSSFFLNPT